MARPPRRGSRGRILRRGRLRQANAELKWFERLVARALDGIPEPFRSKLENVAVVVEEEPGRELLESLGMPPGETLLGLYDGTPLTQRGDSYNLAPPDRIIIFRRPILESFASTGEIEEEVRRTVIHEIAHFYGIGDDELDSMGFS